MDRRDVVITGFRLNATEQPTKILQRLLGVDEAQARALAKRFPSVVRADETGAEAEKLVRVLCDAGAYAHLREPGGRSEPPAPADAPNTVPPANMQIPDAPALAPNPAPWPRPALAGSVAPERRAAPFAPLAAEHAAPGVGAMSSLASPSAAISAHQLATAPTLFSSAQAAPGRLSAYELGELEIVPSKSQPAPPMVGKSEPAPASRMKSEPASRMKSEPAPASRMKSEPAPASRMKSEPAPASRMKSEPAPASRMKSEPSPASKSLPAPRPTVDGGLEAAGLRMLGDSFDDDVSEGPLLELDERALGHQTNRVHVESRGTPDPLDQAPRKRRGFFATLLLPLVLAHAAVPHALALTGVAAASGAAVYIARTSGRADAKETRAELGRAGDKQGELAQKSGIVGLLDKVTGSDSKDSGDARLAAGSRQDKNIDDIDNAQNAGEKASGAAPTHPLIRMAPKAMEGSIASIMRSRIRGLHKVAIKWDDTNKPEGSVECMLLAASEAASLKELASTGSIIQMPVYVREQLQDHILVLRTADADPNAQYLPICLAN